MVMDTSLAERELGGAEIITGGTAGSVLFIDREYNPTLMGLNGIHTYDKMRRSDSSIRSSLRVVKAPLLAAEWYFKPATTDPKDVEVAEFVKWAWENMSRTPIGILWEALLMLDFGYYAFEKVYEPEKWSPSSEGTRMRNVFTWKKFAPRHPLNTIGWAFDANGGVRYLKHNRNPNGYEMVPIPIEKLLIFTLDEEGGNPEGISLLRSAHKHWYMKDVLYKIDAIQKERHGIGVPVAILPPNATREDKALALELVSNIRTNEKAGIVLPNSWAPEVGSGATLKMLELSGQLVDPLESAKHHDMMIKENVLANFLNLGTSGSGSRATGSVQEDIFVKSIHYLADLVCGVFNKWAIPELVRYNFNVDRFPQMKVRRIGDTSDLRALSVSIRNYIESKALTPDAPLEDFLRETLDFPLASPEAKARSIDDRLAVKKPDTNTGNRVDKPTE